MMAAETILMTDQAVRSYVGNFYRRFWYVPDIVCICVVFACITLWHSSYLVWYVGGLRNRAPFMFDPYIWYVLIATPLAGICLIIAAIRLGVSWPRHIQSRGRLLRLRLLVILGFAAYAGLHFVPIPRSYEPFLLGYRKYAETHVDVAAIRMWLNTQDPNAWKDNYTHPGDWRAQDTHWPVAVTSLEPEYVRLSLDDHRRLVIHLGWGHVNDSWGVAVGSIEMQFPMMGLRKGVSGEKSPDGSGSLRRLPLAPGAYVWHDPH
jgi:hypothetical protein